MNILIFGDSTTWGAYDPELGGWVTRLRNYFEAEYGDICVYNLGICGDTTADVLSRIEGEAKSRKPGLIIFSIGINDAALIRPLNSAHAALDEFQQNLGKLFDIAKKFADDVVFIGLTAVDESKTVSVLWNADEFYTNENIKRFSNAIEKFCETSGAKFIPMDGVVEDNDFIDGLHPNAAGHSKIFNRIKPEIESLL